MAFTTWLPACYKNSQCLYAGNIQHVAIDFLFALDASKVLA